MAMVAMVLLVGTVVNSMNGLMAREPRCGVLDGGEAERRFAEQGSGAGSDDADVLVGTDELMSNSPDVTRCPKRP